MAVITVPLLVHELGLALGLGGAFCVEVLALGMIGRPVTEDSLAALRSLARVVLGGFVLLCLSGLAFLVIYWAMTPEKLLNPKLWAKLTIVAVLGLNGIAVHRVALPLTAAQLGRRLFDGVSAERRRLVVLVAVVSTVSWITAAILGTVRELNFVAPAGLLLGTWLVALVIIGLGSLVAVEAALRGRGPLRAMAG